MKHIAESTVRRLSLYLRFLEDYRRQGLDTISSGDLASLGGTTSAQVRKDLSFFGSFGTRGLGYSVPALARRIREILGLEREWRVIIVGAGKIGAALAQFRGFGEREPAEAGALREFLQAAGLDLAVAAERGVEVREPEERVEDAEAEEHEPGVAAPLGPLRLRRKCVEHRDHLV